jgi:hypothetical protein
MPQKGKNEIVNLCKKVASAAISSQVLAPSVSFDKNFASVSDLLFGRNGSVWGDNFEKNCKQQMEERANNPLVRNIIRRFKAADDRRDVPLAKTFLSLCYPYFTRCGMEENFGIKISKRVWHNTHTESLTGLQDINKSIGVTTKRKAEVVDEGMIQAANTFVLDTQVNLVASGTHFVANSHGMLVQLPRCIRKFSIKQCYVEYKLHFPDSKKRLSQGLYEYLLKTIAPTEMSLSVAVDPVLAKCNFKNFIEIRRLIDYITKDQEHELKVYLLNLAEKLQDHLQYSLWNHLEPKGNVSTTSCHNLTNLCSLAAERHQIDGTPTACKECDDIYLLFEELIDATESMPYRESPLTPVAANSKHDRHPLDRNSKEALKGYIIDVLQKNAFTYWSHMIRKHYQHQLISTLIENLDSSGIVVIIDWKMKILAMLYMESQTEFFGKRGMSLQGMMIIWKDSQTGVVKGEFIDVVLSADNKENADASFCALTAGLKDFKARHPDKNHADFVTDGAGCYSGFDFLMHLTMLKALVGISVWNQYLSESGCGKSQVDGHFSFLIRMLSLIVLWGRGEMNVLDAHSLVHVLRTNPIANTRTILIAKPEFNNTHKNLPGKLLTSLHRAFNYSDDDDDDPLLVSVTFRPLANCGDGVTKTVEYLQSRITGVWTVHQPVILEVDHAEIARVGKEVKMCLSDEDRRKKRRIQGLKVESKNVKCKNENECIMASRLRYIEICQSGGVHFCPSCDKRFVQMKCRDLHTAQCMPAPDSSWTPACPKSRDTAHDIILQIVVQSHVTPPAGVKKAIRNNILSTEQIDVPTLGENLSLRTRNNRTFVPSRQESALKSTSKQMVMTPDIYKMLLIGYDKGLAKANEKTFPTRWRDASIAIGTFAATEKFEEVKEVMREAYDRLEGWPRFGFQEILSAEQIKGHFGKKPGELRKTYENSLRKEAKANANSSAEYVCDCGEVVDKTCDESVNCSICDGVYHIQCVDEYLNTFLCHSCQSLIDESNPDNCCATCTLAFDPYVDDVVTCSICDDKHHVACLSLYDSNDVIVCDTCTELDVNNDEEEEEQEKEGEGEEDGCTGDC